MPTRPIYLDYNATTPVDPEVFAAMRPWFEDNFGNPSSKRHPFGWAADEAVQVARETTAALVGAESDGVVFTSGATEALNLAIKGIAASSLRRGRHLITVSTEHSAVLESHETLARAGFEVSVLPVDSEGRVSLRLIEESIREDTVLLTVMWANNETGVLQPISDIHDIARRHGVPLVSDATQAVGKVPVDVAACDVLTISAHKMYGPKGVGALIRSPRARRLRIIPQIEGGGQERGLRGGTLNVPGIVGLGRAAEIASERMPDDARRWMRLRDLFEEGIRSRMAGSRFFGAGTDRLPNTSNVMLADVPVDRVLASAREVALSTGSACGSGTGRPSHVIAAMMDDGLDVPTTLRMSLGRPTTVADVDASVDALVRAAEAFQPAR